MPAVIHEYRFVKASQPVTMRDVASAAAVSVSTVSKALRNDPSIPEARCRAIQEAARRLGYRPNPMVAALMAGLHHGRRRSDPLHIAWIDLWPAGKENPSAAISKPILQGARKRARELGYEIEIHRAHGMAPEQLHRTLSTRGQWGLIIPPVPESAMRYPLDLRGLTGVTIGSSLHEPVMHRVSPHHFQGCSLAFEKLLDKGYGKIGLVLTPEMNERVEGKWLGAFLASQHKLPPRRRIPALLAGAADSAALARWLGRWNPEVVLAAEEWPWDAEKQPPVAWLMPAEHAVGGVGALGYRREVLGSTAVEMVVAQLHRNDRGRPAIPQTVMVDATWEDRS